ncbi:MFS general substrate transporter [Trichoderma citrinoviride]|uniref:MFS general substrate transporter n=1 Tax=Trichoderma citrinoviride TaxID=58853 RepID=A0A2T4BCJ1_9HYPO|nr:MFS general substrate transporter [Trichoderma citrinoviride]PTB66998.1 MFS general substrate transporter [Trichoderma citrinoviride]
MSSLAKELDFMETRRGGDAKSSSSLTIRSRSGDGDDSVGTTDKQAAVATSRSVSSNDTGDGSERGHERDADGNGDGDGDGGGNGGDESGGSELKDHGDEHALTLSRGRCIALVATVTGAAFLNTLSLQSVVIILPTIGHHLSVPDSRQQWIVSSYSLTFGCFLLFWGRIADLYGKRLIFILGSIWVTAVTAANPFVPNEIGFNVFRALHGLGSAANVPTAIGILGVTFPPGKAKNYAFSTYGAGAPLGSVFGNMLAGLMAQYTDWKWIFGVLAIMGGIISVCGILFIPVPPSPSAADKKGPPKIDWIGATLITVGLLALMFALTEGNVVGWDTPWIPVLIVVSILIIAAFAVWQWYLERRLTAASHIPADSGAPAPSPTPPLIKVSIFRNLQFSAVMVIMLLFFAGFNNYLIFTTYFFQEFQGLSPLQTMLRFIPTGVGGATVAIIVSQLLDRVPTLFILITGHVALCIACLLYAVPISPSTSYFAYGLPAMILAVIGSDTTWPCLTLFTSRALPREDQAVGGALINSVGQFGRSIGLAISTAVQTAVMANARGLSVKDAGSIVAWEPESLRGLRAASWMNFAFGIVSMGVVLVAFRTLDIVGKVEPPVSKRKAGEEGVVVRDVGGEKRGEASWP